MGDFNYPDICWQTLSGSSNFSIALCDFVFELNLQQLVESPTHVKGHLLDLVLTSSHGFISNVGVGAPPVSSDHNLISLELNLSELRTPSS